MPKGKKPEKPKANKPKANKPKAKKLKAKKQAEKLVNVDEARAQLLFKKYAHVLTPDNSVPDTLDRTVDDKFYHPGYLIRKQWKEDDRAARKRGDCEAVRQLCLDFLSEIKAKNVSMGRRFEEGIAKGTVEQGAAFLVCKALQFKPKNIARSDAALLVPWLAQAKLCHEDFVRVKADADDLAYVEKHINVLEPIMAHHGLCAEVDRIAEELRKSGRQATLQPTQPKPVSTGVAPPVSTGVAPPVRRPSSPEGGEQAGSSSKLLRTSQRLTNAKAAKRTLGLDIGDETDPIDQLLNDDVFQQCKKQNLSDKQAQQTVRKFEKMSA